jgi:hypothetical protein
MFAAILFEVDRCRIGQGVIKPDGFDEAAISWRPAFSGDNSVARSLLRAHPLQTKFYHALVLPVCPEGIDCQNDCDIWRRLKLASTRLRQDNTEPAVVNGKAGKL